MRISPEQQQKAIKLYRNNLRIINAETLQVVLEYRKEEIALSTSAYAGDDLDKAIVHNGLDFLKIIIAFDFHLQHFLLP